MLDRLTCINETGRIPPYQMIETRCPSCKEHIRFPVSGNEMDYKQVAEKYGLILKEKIAEIQMLKNQHHVLIDELIDIRSQYTFSGIGKVDKRS